jgi:cold-shock-like DNA binding protein
MTGIVSKFDLARGWAFIRNDEGGREVFVHFSKILEDSKLYMRVTSLRSLWKSRKKAHERGMFAF